MSKKAKQKPKAKQQPKKLRLNFSLDEVGSQQFRILKDQIEAHLKRSLVNRDVVIYMLNYIMLAAKKAQESSESANNTDGKEDTQE